MKNFWTGFEKRAEGSLSGGKGFSGGTGKNMNNTGEAPLRQGTQESHGSGEEGTGTDKTLLDRERNPRDFAHGESGPVFRDYSNPNIEY